MVLFNTIKRYHGTTFLVLILSCLLHLNLHSQIGNYQRTSILSSSGSPYPNAISADNFGNVYTVGSFTNELDLDPSINSSYVNSSGNRDIFIQKLDENGNLSWGYKFGGTGYDSGNAVATDKEGNVIIAGVYFGSVDFDPDPNNVEILEDKGWGDIFLLKLDKDGGFMWVKQIGGSVYDVCEAISIDPSDNIVMAGYFWGVSDFDPSEEVKTLTSFNNEYDGFVLKLNNNGDFQWVRQIEGKYWDYALDIDIDIKGNIYTTGSFNSEVDIDPGPGKSVIVGDEEEFFIQKLNSEGEFMWGRVCKGTKIVCDYSENVYLAGNSKLSINKPHSPFVRKLDANGNILWTKTFGSDSDKIPADIEVDIFDDIYVVGNYWVDFEIDTGSGPMVFPSNRFNAGHEIYLLKFNSVGQLVDLSLYGGTYQDSPHAISIDKYGTIHTAGRFEHDCDFDPSNGRDNYTAIKNFDGFIHKISQDFPDNPILNVTSLNVAPLAWCYPNPTNGIIAINFFKELENLTIQVLNAKGQLIYATKDISGLSHQLNLDLDPGVYVIHIFNNNQHDTLSIVVMK